MDLLDDSSLTNILWNNGSVEKSSDSDAKIASDSDSNESADCDSNESSDSDSPDSLQKALPSFSIKRLTTRQFSSKSNLSVNRWCYIKTTQVTLGNKPLFLFTSVALVLCSPATY